MAQINEKPVIQGDEQESAQKAKKKTKKKKRRSFLFGYGVGHMALLGEEE